MTLPRYSRQQHQRTPSDEERSLSSLIHILALDGGILLGSLISLLALLDRRLALLLLRRAILSTSASLSIVFAVRISLLTALLRRGFGLGRLRRI